MKLYGRCILFAVLVYSLFLMCLYSVSKDSKKFKYKVYTDKTVDYFDDRIIAKPEENILLARILDKFRVAVVELDTHRKYLLHTRHSRRIRNITRITEVTSQENTTYFNVLARYADIKVVKVYASWATIQDLLGPGTITRYKYLQELPAGVQDSQKDLLIGHVLIIPHAKVNRLGEVTYRDLFINNIGCQDFETVSRSKATQRYREVFSVTSPFSYEIFQSFVEVLPRLIPYVAFLRKHKSIRIHIEAGDVDHSVVVRELARLGISRKRLVSGNIRAEVLYQPAPLPCLNPHRLMANIMSAYIRHEFLTTMDHEVPDSVLLIQGSLDSEYFDEDLIEEINFFVQGSHRFEILRDFEISGLHSSVRIFNRAAVVIGTYEGLSNIMWCKPGTHVLEVTCEEPSDLYLRLAQVLRLRYTAINCNDASKQILAALKSLQI